MVHVIEALTPPEGNFASPSAIVVNGLPIQKVYYNGTLVRGQAGAAWPGKVVTKEDTWSITSVSDGGRIRYTAQGSSGYHVIGLAYSVEVTKTKNELGLSGTVSCNTDGVSGYSYAMQDGSTGYQNLKRFGELSQSDSVTNPSITISAITSGTTLPDYDGADKISSEIVASGSVQVAYEGTLLSGQAEIVDPTYTASWTRRVQISIPQANPYIQITAQEVSWKRDNTNILYDSTMRAQWSVKIKWASNDSCDLTGTVVTFAVNGRVVADADDSTIERTISGGTTTSTYTLATSTGEETITLSCSWSDGAQGYDSGYLFVPYAVRSKINAAVSDIPANATSSGSLAIAEKSSSIHSLRSHGSSTEDKWPGGWFDTTSLSDVSTIQFIQKAEAAVDNVLIRAPKTITVDSKIVIEGAKLSRGESASGTDRIGFSYTSIKLASVTWGVASNLSFDSDLRLCFKLSISNKTEDSAYITFTIPTTGTTSGTATDIVCNGHPSVSCEEYANLEGTDQDCYTDIRIEPTPTHEYTIYPSLPYTERKNAYNPIYNDALPYALCHVQTASMVLDYGYKRKDPLPDISRMPGTPGFGGFSGFGGTTLWTGPLVATSPANIYSNIVYDKPAPPPYITITGCILPALPAEASDWNYYWAEEGWSAETGSVYSLALRVDELYSLVTLQTSPLSLEMQNYVYSIVTRRTDASALSRIYGDIVLPTITLRLTPSWDSSLAISITDPGNMARVNHDDIGDNIDSSAAYYSNYITYELNDQWAYMQVTGIGNIPAANRKVSVDFIYGTNWEIPTTRYASDTRTIQGIAAAPSSTTIHVGELDLADGAATDLDQALLDLFTAYNARYTTTASREPYTYEITYRSN